MLSLQPRQPGLPACKYVLAQTTKRERDWFSPVLPFFFKQEKPQLECCIVGSKQPQTTHLCWGGLSLPTSSKESFFPSSPGLFWVCALFWVFFFFCCCLKFQARNKAGRHPRADRGLLSSSQGARVLTSRMLSLGWGHASHSHLLQRTQPGRNQTGCSSFSKALCGPWRTQTSLGSCLEICPRERRVIFVTE